MLKYHSQPLCELLLILVFAVLLSTAPCLWSCSREDHSGKVETIRIGVPPLEQNALLYVADHRRLFADHGLHVVIKDYDTGVTAIKGMLEGEVDVAEAAEFPLVRAVFQKEDIHVIACNDKFENDYIVGRRDRGITRISDFKGKRIGVALKTINEFYLGRFLALNGMDIRDVTLVDLAPAQYVKAIAGGEVDAIIAWEPYIHRIEGKSAESLFGRPKAARQCSASWFAAADG